MTESLTSIPELENSLGQERTFGDTTRKVCCWGLSGRIQHDRRGPPETTSPPRHAASITSGEAPNLSLWAFPRKKIAAKSRITIPDHPYLKTSHSRKKIEPTPVRSSLKVPATQRWRQTSIASAQEPPFRALSGLTAHGPATNRGRGRGRGQPADHASLCVQRSLFGLCHRLRQLLGRDLGPVGPGTPGKRPASRLKPPLNQIHPFIRFDCQFLREGDAERHPLLPWMEVRI